MNIIISTEKVKNQFGESLTEHLQFDLWKTTPSIPYTKDQIIKIAKQNAMSRGSILILTKLGKRTPSHFSEMCIGEIVVSLVFYRTYKDIANWINSLKTYPKVQLGKALILGMMKPFYLKWGNKIYTILKDERFKQNNIGKHLADTTTKIELSKYLSKGSRFVIYVGHGRSRGWSGYRGVRWKDIEQFEQKQPIGSMISLSCSSLKNDKEFSIPFGLQWVMEGRCCSFIGTWDSVKIKPLAEITNILLNSLTNCQVKNVYDLIQSINKQILELNDSEVMVNWSKFRLIGNPYQNI